MASQKMVEVELFRDNKDYKDDVFVAVNGKGMTIPRGKKVKVPEAFAKVLNKSLAQDVKAAKMMDDKQEEYRREAERM